jgi:serine/threonine protein kinase
MATVHRAETQGISGFRRPVALKRLLHHLTTDEELVRSFIHEARLASHLRHANCAQTYDLGKVDETYFIAMEYVPGATLQQIVKQCNAAAGLMPIPIALSIVMQILDGLDHFLTSATVFWQTLGIVHRDVSPSNIIVSRRRPRAWAPRAPRPASSRASSATSRPSTRSVSSTHAATCSPSV